MSEKMRESKWTKAQLYDKNVSLHPAEKLLRYMLSLDPVVNRHFVTLLPDQAIRTAVRGCRYFLSLCQAPWAQQELPEVRKLLEGLRQVLRERPRSTSFRSHT